MLWLGNTKQFVMTNCTVFYEWKYMCSMLGENNH